MEYMELEVYSQSINRGVVKMPGRHFPGLVIQGDTLSILLDLANSIHEKLKNTSDTDLIEESIELRDSLQQLVLHYESTLGKHNIPLPYSSIRKQVPVSFV